MARLTIDKMMQQALEIEGLVSLAAGFTDNALMPRQHIADLVAELLADGADPSVLQYGNPTGRSGLRHLLAERVNKDEAAAGATDATRSDGPTARPCAADDVIITNGSQQALFMTTIALAERGDVVLVESPTYFVYLDILASLGVRAIPMPSKDDQLDVAALPAFFEGLRQSGDLDRVKLIYIVSYFANPTAMSWSLELKTGLIDAMRDAELCTPILEDIAYREFYFEHAHNVPSLLTMNTPGPVIATGTLTKTFATGLKVGFLVVQDDALRKRLCDLKRCEDFGTSHFTQAILELAISKGIYDTFLNEMRPKYLNKCRALESALEANGLQDDGWQWQQADGSLYVWAKAPMNTDADGPLHRACLRERVIYVPGSLCCPGGGTDRVRLSFGSVPPDQLIEGAARLARAARAV